MPSDTRESRPARPQVSAAAAGGGTSLHHPPPSPQAEVLLCPRCNSTNTKFCCYNLSQPPTASPRPPRDLRWHPPQRPCRWRLP
ncbi:hypothetical protein NL676_016264 [Syzygium grande]|nr:hypothetical protein NL676_016264 [Syzygium grande]